MSLSASSSSREPVGSFALSSVQPPPNSTFVLLQPMVWFFAVVALTGPFWPLYFKEVGLSESQIGYLSGIGGFASLLTLQFWGYLADVRFNIKWCMIVMSVASAAVSVLFFFFHSFWALAVLVGLFNAVSTARIPMVSALVLDSRDGEKRYGALRTVGTVTFIVVLIAISWLCDRLNTGLRITFWFVFASNLLCALSMIPVKGYPYGGRRMVPHHDQKLPSFMEVQRVLLALPVIRAYILFMLFTQLPHSYGHAMQPVMVDHVQAGANTVEKTLPIVLGAISEIGAFLGFAWMSKRLGLMTLLLLTALGGMLRWALIAAWPTMASIYVSSTMHIFTYGMWHMCSVMLVNRELPERYRSSGQTLINFLALAFGTLLGSFVGGAFIKWVSGHLQPALGIESPAFGLRMFYALGIVVSALAVPCWFVMRSRYVAEHRSESRATEQTDVPVELPPE